MKRYKLIGLIASAMAVALAASSCGSAGTSTTSVSATSGGGSSQVDNSKFVTLSMYNFGDPTNDTWKTVQSQIDDYLKNNTNLNCALELHYMTWTNWQTSYATLLASSQPIDMVTTASDWLNMWQNAQKGAFYDITNLLPTYAPDLYAGTPQSVWDLCKFNGKIICTPEDQYTQWVNQGFMYRNDWAKSAGITDGISNWDQLTQYFSWIKANKPSVYPWDAGSQNGSYATMDGYLNSYTSTIQMAAATDDPSMWVMKSPTDTTVTCPYTDPEYTSLLIQYATLMKQWGDAGYFPTNVMNGTDADATSFKAGTSGVIQHHVQDFRSFKQQFDTVQQPGADMEFFGFWQPSGVLTKLSVTHGATAIGAHSQNAGRALEFLNLIYTDKTFYMLFNYGILNQTYFLNDQGQIYTPTTFDSNKDGYSPDFWGGRLDKFEPPSAIDFPGYQDYSDSLSKIAVALPFDGCPFDLTSVQKQVNAVEQVVTSEQNPIAWGKAGDPTAAINKFSADLKAAGVDDVTAVLQQEYDTWKAQQPANDTSGGGSSDVSSSTAS